MTTKKHKNLHEWLNLGVDFNPGSAKYGEMTSIIEAKLKAAPTGKLAHVDHRIQQFMDEVFGENSPKLVQDTFVLDQHGLARTVALPKNGNTYSNPILNTFRVTQGILHNPSKDKRTTKGVFYVVEYGLPIPDDKKPCRLMLLAKFLRPPFKYRTG